jgi:putative tryptophan/tyrosine transport system substrate-binding protein
MAARGAGAATGDAGDRISPPLVARNLPPACIPPGLERRGLGRRRERHDRIPLGRQPNRSAAGAGGGIGAATGPCDRDRGPPAVSAAKAATTTIPVVFLVGEDPVKLGLVTSLGRPGGNLTGVNFLAVEIAAKRLELLRELVPGAARIAVLVNPANVSVSETVSRDVSQAARAMGLQIKVINADTIRAIDAAFAMLANERADALFLANDPFFIDRRVQLAQLAAHHSLPPIGQDRLYAEVGGLISYGANLGDAYRQVGIYTGRIINGAKPADLPVVQSARFELVINASTARMLGIAVPQTLLVAADEVIE